MVKSNLCWLNILDKTDCHFDYGGYFVIKGAEKVNPVDRSKHMEKSVFFVCVLIFYNLSIFNSSLKCFHFDNDLVCCYEDNL